MTSPAPSSTTSDLLRAVALLASVVIAVVVGTWGAGAWGATPVEEVAYGALADDATLLSPASTAFSIWSVIYTGLAVLAVVALLPSRRGSERLRSSTWLVAGASLLSAAWIALVQAEALWPADIVIVGMVALLAMAGRRLPPPPPPRGGGGGGPPPPPGPPAGPFSRRGGNPPPPQQLSGDPAPPHERGAPPESQSPRFRR